MRALPGLKSLRTPFGTGSLGVTVAPLPLVARMRIWRVMAVVGAAMTTGPVWSQSSAVGPAPPADPYTLPAESTPASAPPLNMNAPAREPEATVASLPPWSPGSALGSAGSPPAGLPVKPHPASALFQPAETVARVGEECVFRGDLEGDAELILATMLHKIPPEEREKNRSQLDDQREKLVAQLLKQAVDRKLMYLEFIRNQPTDKLKEVKANIDRKIGEAFEEDLNEVLAKLQKSSEEEYNELARQDSQLFRLALYMHQQGISTTVELDRYLRRLGTSVKYQQQAFAERKLGQQQLYTSIEMQPEIMPDEMLQYYRERQQEFVVPMRAKWERLTARFDRFPDKAACGAMIAEMGNEVVLGGAPFWAVAKRRSQGADADKGGLHDWTNWGDLSVSRPLHEAVFSLPLQQLSAIIEDAEGLHIVRVIEREETHTIPFTEAQVEIKKTLQAEKRAAEVVKYIEQLRKRTPIWTIHENGDSELVPPTAEQ